MRSISLALALSLSLALALAAAACSPASGGEGLDEDARHAAELAAATREARAKLPYFWEHLEAPDVDEYDFTVKASLRRTDGEAGEELVWIEDIVRMDAGVSGRLGVAPRHQPLLSRGDRVAVTEDAIVDWAFFRGDALIGHYTTRTMLHLLPPDEADILRALFGPNPESP